MHAAVVQRNRSDAAHVTQSVWRNIVRDTLSEPRFGGVYELPREGKLDVCNQGQSTAQTLLNHRCYVCCFSFCCLLPVCRGPGTGTGTGTGNPGRSPQLPCRYVRLISSRLHSVVGDGCGDAQLPYCSLQSAAFKGGRVHRRPVVDLWTSGRSLLYTPKPF